MPITLKIEDRGSLPDGGPIEFTAGARGFDIGREQHLDWCLPDPERVVSGHHCQVRYDNGTYWLNDISTNGTYVNDAPGRVKSPYRLVDGDRLQIGNYHVRVLISGDQQPAAPQVFAPPQPPPAKFAAVDDIWASPQVSTEPVDRSWFIDKQRQDRGVRTPDVLEQFMDLPTPTRSSPFSDDFRPIPAPPLGNVPGSAISEHSGPPSGAVPAPAPHRAPGPQTAGGMSAEEFLRQVCAAAGLPPQTLSLREPAQVARDIGEVLRIATEQMTALLQGRANAKRLAKSGNRTMIGASDNNPMKFTPDAAEALEIMFQRSRAGYLDGPASFRQAFADIHAHERATFAAMQKALSRVTEDLSPESVEDKVTGVAFGSRKGRAWDIYQQRWSAKTEHYENGILDVFLVYFAEIYDGMTKKE